MRKKRTSISVSFDPEVVEAGRAAVAEGRAWSFSAWINQAARRQMAEDQRLVGVGATQPNRSLTTTAAQ
ncbi:MAG: hypothetical protein ACRD2C_27320 [Acidimicrobiales bacterium]